MCKETIWQLSQKPQQHIHTTADAQFSDEHAAKLTTRCYFFLYTRQFCNIKTIEHNVWLKAQEGQEP